MWLMSVGFVRGGIPSMTRWLVESVERAVLRILVVG
jgi:hypothetical protein